MKNKAISIAVAALLASAHGMAQTAMTLDDCLRAARDNNMVLQSGKIAIERAKDLQATAYDLDKTGISLSQTPTTGGGPENALTFSQSFEFPTVYGARRGVLKAQTRLQEAQYLLDRNTLEREVESAYCSLAYALQRQRMLAAQDSIYSRFADIAEARYKAGESSALERMNARRLQEENRLSMAEAARQVAQAQLQLGCWLNTDEAIVPAEPTLAPLPYTPADMTGFNPQNAPTVALAEQENVVAEKNLRLARQAFMPDISLGASTQLLIKGFNPYDVDRSRFSEGNFMGFEVGISVPLFYGAKRARVRSAKKEVEQSRLRMEQERKNAAAEHSMALNEYLQAKQRLDYYSDKGNADAAETYRLAQLSYEKGEIVYVEYIQNLQAALALQLAAAEAIDQYNQALIRLKYAQSRP